MQEFRRSMEGLNERYVKAETLCEHVEVLTPDWLKRHGSCFNRTKMIWTDKTGRRHEDGLAISSTRDYRYGAGWAHQGADGEVNFAKT